jgi:putative transposase
MRATRPTIVFVSVCTKSKKRILAKPDGHTLLREAWREADARVVGRHVVMPNHIHLFCAPSV